MPDEAQGQEPKSDLDVKEQSDVAAGAAEPEAPQDEAGLEQAEAEALLPPGSVKVEDAGTLRKKITVTVPRLIAGLVSSTSAITSGYRGQFPRGGTGEMLPTQ